MRDFGRGVVASIEDIEAKRERELFAAMEQVENDLIDGFTVRPISAKRAIKALEPYLLGSRSM